MKRGFTLIELVAVIFLLGMILIIVVPIINDNLMESKSNLSTEQIRQIESAARQWGVDNLSIQESKPVDMNGNEVSEVTIRTLQTKGYLDDKAIIDAKTKEEISYTYKVCISYEDNQFVYEYKGSDSCNG